MKQGSDMKQIIFFSKVFLKVGVGFLALGVNSLKAGYAFRLAPPPTVSPDKGCFRPFPSNRWYSFGFPITYGPGQPANAGEPAKSTLYGLGRGIIPAHVLDRVVISAVLAFLTGKYV
jgi:hypothetical protein